MIHHDFEKLFPGKLDAVKTRWSNLEKFILEYIFIDLQLKKNSEAQDLTSLLPQLSDTNKQVVLLLHCKKSPD